jgi:hypothetical protein
VEVTSVLTKFCLDNQLHRTSGKGFPEKLGLIQALLSVSNISESYSMCLWDPTCSKFPFSRGSDLRQVRDWLVMQSRCFWSGHFFTLSYANIATRGKVPLLNCGPAHLSWDGFHAEAMEKLESCAHLCLTALWEKFILETVPYDIVEFVLTLLMWQPGKDSLDMKDILKILIELQLTKK